LAAKISITHIVGQNYKQIWLGLDEANENGENDDFH